MNTLYVKNWIRERIEGQDRVNIGQVVDELLASMKPAELRELAVEHIRGVAFELARKETANSRRSVRRQKTSEMPEQRHVILKPVTQKSWGDWLEWNGSVHVRLMEMTREDLEAAARIRLERGTREAHLSEFERSIAARLLPGQRVSEVFSEEQVQQIYEDTAAMVDQQMAATMEIIR
mgnify:CR=1 FL=1